MKLGIALGGGGAKGFAHIGILKAFSDAGIEFDIITGTSIGALVGAMYAGDALPALEEQAANIALTDIPKLLSPAWSTGGLFSGKSAFDLFENLIEYQKVEDLPRTFAAVSVDLVSSKVVTHSSGDLRTAVRASASIPAIFTPVVIGDQILVDGGTLEPVPIEIARQLGADYVVAVNLFGSESPSPERLEELSQADKQLWPAGISTAIAHIDSLSDKFGLKEMIAGKFKAKGERVNIMNVLERTLSVSQQVLTQSRLREFPPDVLIEPPVSHVGTLDFHRGESIISVGFDSAQNAIESVKSAL